MCGIFGFVVPRGQRLEAASFEAAIRLLFRLSEPRGKEASGLLIAAGPRIDVLKRPVRPSRFLASQEFRDFLDRGATLANGEPLAEPVVVIGHCRLVTHGVELLPANNQPVVAGRTVGVHNGIVTNHSALVRQHQLPERAGQLDSEVLFRLVDRHADEVGDAGAATARAFADVKGTASVAFLVDGHQLVLATNVGSLYLCHDAERAQLVFTSERHSLDQYLLQAPLPARGSVRQLRAGTGLSLQLPEGTPRTFLLGGAAASDGERPAARPAPRVVEHTTARRLRELRRCARCILPTTYPFLELDAEGVCNYCRSYRPPQLAGPDALERELAKHRRGDGQPDCIVAFSGGRDSSYGLHLLKRELGMTPVAFSYDWGMVTGIARRNQARMCGQLEVEHILRAADIPAKRRYLRKNILAWLERPHLGMVPLFMAGDKFFYQVARELRRELRIPLVVFCAGNPLERTDFKGGFAGVRESLHGQRLFAFSLQNKAQIALFYGLQYLQNPAYFNESFGESLRSFVETFVVRDDFLYLYHYLPWDEATITATLQGEYGWETAGHTDNTWRIGDGYTTFINHIYYTVAGFSEFDAFRSQQIRAGLLERTTALELAERDNQPDLDVLAEFASQVGLNLEEVLTRIDGMDRLY
ncbi:MAG: hypothetical protein JRI55_02660 [Deltaproteobacteria bacterium]|jgi:asparagine synthetase B (glutamine-hydrolysing)|nr:hypothetical protein [Deltaproteobacteria bacterium]